MNDKNELLKSDNWVAGLQWLFFIFTNIVVIPVTVGAAFDLSQERIASMLQLSFIITGLATVAQALFGHKRAVMEGQSGLWWGVILVLTTTAAAQGLSLKVVGGSLAIGVLLSGLLTIFIGLAGLGPYLVKFFNSSVMGVFMFLLGCQLVSNFLQGMLGLPFGHASGDVSIDVSVSLLSIGIVIAVVLISIKAPKGLGRYAVLAGIIIGWIAYSLIFGQDTSTAQSESSGIALFPLGEPVWNTGIIITTIIAGLVNTANTIGSLRGTDDIYNEVAGSSEYRKSFTITGVASLFSGIFGLVPYAPFVSSIGFLDQTGIIKRLPLAIGGFMFFLMGVIPPVGDFFSMLPLSVGSAVLFVSYVQLLNSSLNFFKEVSFSTLNIYRASIPLFTGIIVMTMPAEYFASLPGFIQPLLSNGFLVGVMLALLMENLIDWDRFSGKSSKIEDKGNTEESYG